VSLKKKRNIYIAWAYQRKKFVLLENRFRVVANFSK